MSRPNGILHCLPPPPHTSFYVDDFLIFFMYVPCFTLLILTTRLQVRDCDGATMVRVDTLVGPVESQSGRTRLVLHCPVHGDATHACIRESLVPHAGQSAVLVNLVRGLFWLSFILSHRPVDIILVTFPTGRAFVTGIFLG